MKDQEILEKAIQKAIDGGWEKIGSYVGVYDIAKHLPTLLHFTLKDGSQYYCDIEHIIFNHDFAKALWGEHDIEAIGNYERCRKCGDSYTAYEFEWDADSCWEYHLRKMVIADDPIKYLGDNI